MINLVLCGLLRLLLKLRYRVTVAGLDAVASRGRSGILFLPNHPALIDPAIVMSLLYSRFRPRPLADQDQVGRPGVRWVAAQLNVITIPDATVYGDAGRQAVEEGVARCIETLKAGANVLLYPAGRIQRQRYEDLAGTSAVETILAGLPEVRVVLLRTRGLWGSAFGRAAGAAPALGRVFKKALLSLLANGVFFSPRRPVSVEVVEPSDFPRHADRATLNRYLERFYNENTLPARQIPYTLWERGGARDLPEPTGGAGVADVNDVPVAPANS